METRKWAASRYTAFWRAGSLILAVAVLGCTVALGGDVTTPMDQFMMKRGFTVVPLRRGSFNHLYCHAKLRGKSIVCLVDTGVTDLMVDTRFSGGLKPLGPTATPAYGLFGRFADELPTVWVDSFEIAGVVFTNQEAMVASLHRNERVKTGSYIPTGTPGEEEEAIIGMGLLRNMHAWLDCYAPRLYVRLEKPDGPICAGMDQSFRASGFAVAPAKPLGMKLFAEAEVNGKPALFEVDTGEFDTTIALDQLDAFQLANKERLGMATDLGGKKKDLTYALLESLTLGEFELKRYPVGTQGMPILTQHNDELKKRGLPPVIGLLGPDVLDKSRAFIDCDGGRMFLMPEKTKH